MYATLKQDKPIPNNIQQIVTLPYNERYAAHSFSECGYSIEYTKQFQPQPEQQNNENKNDRVLFTELLVTYVSAYNYLDILSQTLKNDKKFKLHIM